MQNEKIAEEKFMNEEEANMSSENLAGEQFTKGEESAIEKLQSELTEQKDKYIRLYSDFENSRRRFAKDKLDFVKNANEEIIVALLPVVDDFERALTSLEKTNDSSVFAEGIKLIHSKLNKTLSQKGLKPIEAKGEDFDTELHEAITQFPAPDESLKGKVIEEVEKGYYLNDKVIRFSKVIIGS